MRFPDTDSTLRPAAYLRYSPRNTLAADQHREALRAFAARRGLRTPALYLDNGCPPHGVPPRQEQLLRAVVAGSHRLLIVPGPWVFSSDETRTNLTIRLITAAGCRIVLLPTPPEYRPLSHGTAVPCAALPPRKAARR